MGVRLPQVLAAALGLGLLTAAPAGADAENYDFVVIADSADGFRATQMGCPALNNAGQVAFSVRSSDQEEHVLRGSSGPLTTIADGGTKYVDFSAPSINSAGEVAFRGVLSDGTVEVYRGDEASMRRIATTRRIFEDLIGFPSINDAGRVAFDAQFEGTDAGLFVGKNPRLHRVYTFASSDFRGDGDGVSAPSLGDGAVAFSSLRKDAPSGVFRQSYDGTLTTIVEADDSMYKFRGASLNAKGEVAFAAFLEGGDQAIMAGNGGPLRTVADTSGPFRDLAFSLPSLNDDGTVAFTASLDGFDSALFVGPDPVADRVAGSGDAIAGSTIEDLYACAQALNDVGQLSFWADLTDGRRVIVRADPV